MTKEIDTSKIKKSWGGKPLQSVSWAEKSKNDFAWAKETINYFKDRLTFDIVPNNFKEQGLNSKSDLYDFYNNNIPSKIFDYVSNPLKAKKEKFQGFPAKIRPYNIMRPNIDLLIGEWNKRPFLYDVKNVDGDDSFNAFEEAKTKMFRDNVIQRLINTMNELNPEGTGMPTEEIGNPKTLMSEFNLKYKDAKALKGYRALRVLEEELYLRETWRRLFKDWTIAGEVYTLKMARHGYVEYLRLSSDQVAWEESETSKYVEDGDNVLVRFRMNTSELVDFFYDKLTKEQVLELEKVEGHSYSSRLYNYFRRNTTDSLSKHDVVFCAWKARKTIGFLRYRDPLTGEELYDIVDEDYKPDKEAGEEVEWLQVNEAWKGWKIDDDKFVDIGPLEPQRNEMNNFSTCKLPVNGKRFSDTSSDNVSIAFLSIPYQVLYIILMYRLELTIAKSKGKIVLMDRNIIPEDDGEEGFFWYSEALGYALVDRMQDDVDRSWNQYQVLDLSLFQHIKELMVILDYVKAQLEELLGITRQRKGNITASDGLGTSEQAIFRGNVISDLLFTGFEEFLERELQGLLDLTKFAWVDGKKGSWRNDEGRLEMLSIEPDEYAASELGVNVVNISKHIDRLNMLKNQINAIAQRKDVKTSTIIDLLTVDSFTELKALALKAEAIEQEIIQRTAESEQQAQADMQQAQQQWELFMHNLELDRMHQEYDRKEELEAVIKRYEQENFSENTSGEDFQKAAIERLKIKEQGRQADNKNRIEREWMNVERFKIRSNERVARQKNAIVRSKSTQSRPKK